MKGQWDRAGLSAAYTIAVLRNERGDGIFSRKKMKEMCIVMFCFSVCSGKTAVLWPIDFEFEVDFSMSGNPDVLKRTGTDCMNNTGARPYPVPVQT